MFDDSFSTSFHDKDLIFAKFGAYLASQLRDNNATEFRQGAKPKYVWEKLDEVFRKAYDDRLVPKYDSPGYKAPCLRCEASSGNDFFDGEVFSKPFRCGDEKKCEEKFEFKLEYQCGGDKVILESILGRRVLQEGTPGCEVTKWVPFYY